MRSFLALTLTIGMTAVSACKTDDAGTSSEVKDLPSFLQPDRVQSYRLVTPETLDILFKNAPSPEGFPNGYAGGIHIIPDGSRAQVPTTLTVVTKRFWKGKTFNGHSGIMTDDLLGPNLGVGAQLRLEPMRETLKRYGWDALDPQAFLDDRPSLITDYRGYRMMDAPSTLTKDTKGWVDECRVVDYVSPLIWLCRSTYNGLFWGYVVLQMQ